MTAAYLARRLGGLLLAVCFAAGLTGLPPIGLATQAEAQVVSRIVVEGNQRVEETTILSYLRFQVGEERIDVLCGVADAIERVLRDWTSPPTPVHVVYPSTRHLSPKVKSFVDHLQERMTPPPWELGPAP